MSQYYPQQGPLYPPEYSPEYDDYDEGDFDYYDDDEDEGPDSSLLQSVVAFFAGGCLVFLCMISCILVGVAGWILDPGAGLTEPTPIPGSDIGLTFESPAFPDESVVNEQNMQLTILEVNRNASVSAIPPVEGREVIIVTIELVNVGDEDAPFNERDFMLLNTIGEAYAPAIGAVSGSLGRGTLPPDQGLEGRLVYEIIAGEFDLRLLWEPDRDSAPRFIFLE